MSAHSNTATRIRELLAPLQASYFALSDDSAQHAGHAGAASGGGHFSLTIVSESFVGQNSLKRHRSVFALVAPLMQREIHALSITALNPTEAQSAGLKLD